MSVVNVAVIGVGLVGKEFLQQLATVASNHSNRQIRLIYASNSTRSLYDIQNGIPLDSWAYSLSSSKALVPPSDLPDRLKADLHIDQSPSSTTKQVTVVVDNTSSDKIAALYPAFLKNGIDVITPNKKAYSSGLKLYDAIIEGSNQGGGRFLNESTVGAGLPIISTLKDLIATGDEVSRGNLHISRGSYPI
jgi:homoserine dehydrogenase